MLLWKSNKYYIIWVCVCSLRCPVCNAQVPYCHQYPVCTIFFPHYLINRTIFGKELLGIKCAFWYSLQVLSETFLILTRISEIVSQMYTGYRWSSRYSSQILTELEFLVQWSEKYSNIKFHCFTVHFDSLSFIHTNSCTFSYNYVSVF